MVPKSLLALGVFAGAASAQMYKAYSPLSGTCWNEASNFNFGCEAYDCNCQSLEFLGTTLVCIREKLPNASGGELEYAYKYIQMYCSEVYEWSFTELDDIYYNASKYLIDPPNNMTDLVFSPVNVTDIDNDLKIAAKSEAYTYYYQYYRGLLYGCMTIAYFVGLMILATIHNFVLHFYSDFLFKMERAIGFGKIRKYFTLSATFKERHSRPYRLFNNVISSCAPTRGESLIVIGFLVLNIVFLLVSYGSPVDDLPNFYTGPDFVILYGFRAGALAYIQVPLVIVFACRNNWFITLTGWPYSTFQVYHRWVARTMVAHSIIHTAIYFYQEVYYKEWSLIMSTEYFYQYGFVAVLAGTFMLMLSFYYVRQRFYEFFYLTHKLLYIAFFIGLAVHVWVCGWMLFIWISVGIHVAERLTRIIKVIFAGLKNSAVAKLHDDGIITISVKYSTRWSIRPGQYCYIRILSKKLFWQAHPLSIFQSPDPSDTTMHFALKSRGGATLALKKYLEEQPSNSATISVFIEGPYGHEAPVENYKHLFLMAGGIGVTATYQYALEARGRGQHVVFMWVIPDLRALEYFGDELLALLSDPNIEVQVYITRDFSLSGGELEDSESMLYTSTDSEKKSGDFNESSTENNKNVSLTSAQLIKTQYANVLMGRRPIVGEEVTKMVNTKDTVAIVSCGPPTFVDNIRESVVDNITSAKERVDYFEEAFSW